MFLTKQLYFYLHSKISCSSVFTAQVCDVTVYPGRTVKYGKQDPKPLLDIMGGCLGSNRHRDHSSRESSDVAGSMFWPCFHFCT